MAASRYPPAQPGASSIGKSGQGKDEPQDRETAQARDEAQGRAAPGIRKSYGPPPLPPPLRPVGPPAPFPLATSSADEGDEQTMVDPQASSDVSEPLDLAPPELAPDLLQEIDIDQKSTTTETMEDSEEELRTGDAALLDLDHLAAGTGETSGGSVDEPTKDEVAHDAPQLAVVPAPPRSPAAPHPRMPSSPSDAALSPAWLVVQSGTDRGRRFALRTGRTSIGRGVDNDVVLTDIAVSRKHLIIDFDGTTYVMSDLGSGNGTLINDRDEDGAYRLSHGDKLELGNTVLVFECTVVGLQSQPHGKWPVQDDDDLSTVAGRPMKIGAGMAHNAGNGRPAVPPPFPRAPSHPGGPPPLPLPRPLGGPRPGHLAAAARGPTAPPIPRPTVDPTSGPLMRPPMQSAQQMRSARPPMPSAPPGAPTMSTEAAMGNRSLSQPSFSPYPGPPGGQVVPMNARPMAVPIPYPSAPAGFSMSPSPASSPRFQYPNGVMAPIPSAERRRVLIIILGTAFVAVGAGIVMAVINGSGSKGGTASARAPAASAGKTTQPVAPPASTTTQPTPDGTLRQLYGERELRPVDFGTDEQFLSDVAGAATESTPASTPAPPVVDDEEEVDQAAAREERRAARRDARRRRASREAEPIEEVDASSDETATEEVDTGDVVDSSTALRKAESLYRQKRFAEAASLLRDAADSASKRDGGRMRALAVSYAKIGTLLGDGQDSLVSDAPKALQSFKNALRLDEEFGDSFHDRTIGARIAQVAPAAAGAYMARKDYAEARAAADIAEKFGAGDSDRVRIVRSSLERKAEQLYEEALAQADGGETQKAAETARVILRMVPRSSDIYAKAAKLAAH